MEIITEFTLGFGETRKKIAEEILRELYAKRRKIKEHKTGIKFIGDDIYQMNEEDGLYKEVVHFAREYPEEIELSVRGRRVKCDEKDVQKAIAFIPGNMKKWCEEYADSSPSYESCNYCYADSRRVMQKEYIKTNKFLKLTEEYCDILKVDSFMERFIVTIKLFHELVQKGIEREYFIPVYTKQKKIIGYEILSQDILPADSLVVPNCFLKSECGICGAKHYIEKENSFYETPYLSKRGEESMKTISMTEEFYYKQRVMLFNKKLYQLIKEYVPDAEFFPVFPQNEDDI